MPKKKKRGTDTQYAHNPRYCMITPDPLEKDEENISSANQS